MFIRVIGGEAILCGRSSGLCTHLNMSLLFLKKQLGIKAFREKQMRDVLSNILPSTCQRFYRMTLHLLTNRKHTCVSENEPVSKVL